MKIKRHIIAGIEKHAWGCSPAECCGLLAGRGDTIDQLYRLTNIASTPETRYVANPKEIIRATKRMRRRGEQLLGIYHSHTHTPAYPSTTDIEQAYYPEVVYFILSLAPTLQLRAFRIRERQVEEVRYEIVDDHA